MINSAESEHKPTKHGILSLTIKDKTVLYAAYMPHIINGYFGYYKILKHINMICQLVTIDFKQNGIVA